LILKIHKEIFHGKTQEITQEVIVDEIAGMATILIGKTGNTNPVEVFQWLEYSNSRGELFMQNTGNKLQVASCGVFILK